VERLLCVFGGEQIVDVRDAYLRRIAWVDGTAACSCAVQFLRRVIGVNNVFGFQSETGEVRIEERCIGVGVQKTRYADAEVFAPVHK
jgi:hypothetical protein